MTLTGLGISHSCNDAAAIVPASLIGAAATSRQARATASRAILRQATGLAIAPGHARAVASELALPPEQEPAPSDKTAAPRNMLPAQRQPASARRTRGQNRSALSAWRANYCPVRPARQHDRQRSHVPPRR